ncbi:hypothetical protein KC960_01950 [Candidatus Saccharibacteria bacterium]|nr:hypothetical protein [Candidatus Saccharibacteria bacterium]
MKIPSQARESGRHSPYCVLSREMCPDELAHAPGLKDLAGFVLEEAAHAIEISASFARAAGSTALDFLHTAKESLRI